MRRSMRTLVALAAAAGLFGAAACSSNDDAASTTTTAGATTTAAEQTTTSAKTDSPLDRLARGTATADSEAKAEEIASSPEAEAFDLTEDEVECLAEYFAGTPELAEIGDTPTPDEAQLLMAVIASCIPQDKFVAMVMVELDDGTYSTEELECIETLLMGLSSDEMAGLMTEDATVLAELESRVSEDCGLDL